MPDPKPSQPLAPSSPTRSPSAPGRRWLAPVALVLAAGGCSGDEPEAPAEPGPEPAAEQGPPPSAGPVATAPAPSGLALFAVHSSSTVVPLACRTAEGEVLTRARCMDVVPSDATVRGGEGHSAAGAGPTTVQCASAGRSFVGLSLSSSLDVWPVVTWSHDEAFPWCPFARSAAGGAAPQALLQTIAQQAVQYDLLLDPPDPSEITVTPLYKARLEEGGGDYRFFRAVWPPPEPQPRDPDEDEGEDAPPPEPQQELFLVPPGKPPRRVILPGKGRVDLVGAVDLDEDGTCELIYGEEWSGGSGAGILKWDGNEMTRIAHYSCGI